MNDGFEEAFFQFLHHSPSRIARARIRRRTAPIAGSDLENRVDQQPFIIYLEHLSQAVKTGNATEHTHRPALKQLIESLDSAITATNEPKRIACGAPDYIVTRGSLPLGYIEAKDLGADLDAVEVSEQLQRYRAGLGNLLLTDYREFRWYVAGERRLTARLTEGSVLSVAELLTQFLTVAAPLINTPRELAMRLAAQAQLLRGWG